MRKTAENQVRDHSETGGGARRSRGWRSAGLPRSALRAVGWTAAGRVVWTPVRNARGDGGRWLWDATSTGNAGGRQCSGAGVDGGLYGPLGRRPGRMAVQVSGAGCDGRRVRRRVVECGDVLPGRRGQVSVLCGVGALRVSGYRVALSFHAMPINRRRGWGTARAPGPCVVRGAGALARRGWGWSGQV